jgi:ribosome modulation factor
VRKGSTLGLPLLCGALVLTGCGASSAAIDEAYARGYNDGAASVENGTGAADQSYERGYADGLADSADAPSDELCQRCYGLGYSEGYQAGLSAASNTTTPQASAES